MLICGKINTYSRIVWQNSIIYIMQKTLSVISLPAIRHNCQLIRSIIGNVFFFAVVKADAYGHGAEEVSLAIERIVDGYCVAIVEEGMALRIAGIKKPILVLTPPLDMYDALRMGEYNLIATVGDNHSAKLSKNLTAHIAVNSGMNRYGCRPDNVYKLIKKFEGDLQGVYSHLYMASDKARSLKQLCVFEQAVSDVGGNIIRHLSASGGLLSGSNFLLDGVRCGLLMYGYAPNGFKLKGLQPALKVYAKRAQKVDVYGEGLGYNVMQNSYKNLSVYRLGYADGYAINTPLTQGNICMDSHICPNQRKEYNVINKKVISFCNVYELLTKSTMRSERVYER